MKIGNHLTRFALSERWQLHPPAGSPRINFDQRTPRVQIPPDVLEFYELCGGLNSIVIRDTDLILSVTSPIKFSWALPAILGEAFELLYLDFEKDISRYWYLIGMGDTDEYFMIDLSASRFGRCYFVNLYFFGQPGRVPIVAHSFSNFLDMLYIAAENGEQWSWYTLGLGDAYDLNR